MKAIIRTTIVLAAIALGTNALAFTDGNLVIFRMGPAGGGPVGTLTNAGTVVFLDEYTTNGAATGVSVMMPTNYFGANSPLLANGTAFGNGLITRSVDGRFILVAGYGATPGPRKFPVSSQSWAATITSIPRPP